MNRDEPRRGESGMPSRAGRRAALTRLPLALGLPWLGGLGAAAGLGMLGGCAAVPGGRRIHLGKADLRRSLLRQFPPRMRVLQIFDLTFGEPVLQLLPARNRLALAVDMQGRDRLVGSAFSAALGFDAGLRWQASDATVHLADVRVDRLDLQRESDAPVIQTAGRRPTAAGSSTLARVGRYLAEEALEGLQVHQLKDAQRQRLRQAGLTVSSLEVVDSGLLIQLAPAGR